MGMVYCSCLGANTPYIMIPGGLFITYALSMCYKRLFFIGFHCDSCPCHECTVRCTLSDNVCADIREVSC